MSYSCVWEACPAQVDVFYMQKELYLCCFVLEQLQRLNISGVIRYVKKL